jgi:predicted DNA-binding transcriptional regulator AlpA
MNGPVRANTIDPLLHSCDVAKILNVSTSWLAKERMSGTGPRFVKIGRSVRYPEAALREYIRRGLADPPVRVNDLIVSSPESAKTPLEVFALLFHRPSQTILPANGGPQGLIAANECLPLYIAIHYKE